VSVELTESDGVRIPEDVKRRKLERLFNPRTIAMVGADESNPYAKACLYTVNSDADVYFVNGRSNSFYDHPTVPTLADIGVPVDAVYSMMSAERTTNLAEEAADLGAGGLITIAGGFAEVGGEGAKLQDRLRAAGLRGSMPIIGPNGVGYINVPKFLDLTMFVRFERRVGGVSIISHSGAVLESFSASAWRAGGVGLNMLISAGNEPVTDMADYLDYLVDDPATRVICLVVEKIRRPAAFFAAAARARVAGKPIVAIKLARSERTQKMAKSHTGSLTGDAWVYEQAFKQAGIQLADEVDELVDRVQFLEQIKPEKWSPVRGLFVLTATGGFASMAADLAESEQVEIPDVPELAEWVGTVLPGTTVANPLDATGFVATRHELFTTLMEKYTSNPAFDAVAFFHQVAEWDTRATVLSTLYADFVKNLDMPGVISPLAGHGGRWLEGLRGDNEVGVGNGLRGSLRGLSTMSRFVRSRQDARVTPATDVPEMARPTSVPVESEIGPILSFRDTMELLTSVGVPTARFHIVESNEAVGVPFPGPYVVKLADLAHRSEHDAVRLGVDPAGLSSAVEELRDLAQRESLPSVVTIQEMVSGRGEAFVGVRGSSELGPVLAFGLGGIFVEVLKRVSGRLAPLSKDDAKELVAEFDDLGVLDGVRGQAAWDRDQLEGILVSVGQLAAAGRSWIDTIDINPLIQGPDGLVAVDGLVVLRTA
jgi:acetate---CoA ligase (ADP-forming)